MRKQVATRHPSTSRTSSLSLCLCITSPTLIGSGFFVTSYPASSRCCFMASNTLSVGVVCKSSRFILSVLFVAFCDHGVSQLIDALRKSVTIIVAVRYVVKAFLSISVGCLPRFIARRLCNNTHHWYTFDNPPKLFSMPFDFFFVSVRTIAARQRGHPTRCGRSERVGVL